MGADVTGCWWKCNTAICKQFSQYGSSTIYPQPGLLIHFCSGHLLTLSLSPFLRRCCYSDYILPDGSCCIIPTRALQLMLCRRFKGRSKVAPPPGFLANISHLLSWETRSILSAIVNHVRCVVLMKVIATVLVCIVCWVFEGGRVTEDIDTCFVYQTHGTWIVWMAIVLISHPLENIDDVIRITRGPSSDDSNRQQ